MYVSLDFEHDNGAPFQIGAVDEDGREFCSMMNPGVPVDDDKLIRAHVSRQEVESAPYYEEVFKQFLEWLPPDHNWIGHSFNQSETTVFKWIIRKSVQKFHFRDCHVYDTLLTTPPHPEGRELSNVYRREVGGTFLAHNALSDAKAAMAIFKKRNGVGELRPMGGTTKGPRENWLSAINDQFPIELKEWANIRANLTTPFNAKEDAKQLGAKWDRARNCWFYDPSKPSVITKMMLVSLWGQYQDRETLRDLNVTISNVGTLPDHPSSSMGSVQAGSGQLLDCGGD